MTMDADLLHRICKQSFQKMLALKTLNNADIGIRLVSGYEFYDR